MTAVVAVASSSAKVAKTALSSNLAHYLNAQGHRSALLVTGCSSPVFGVKPDTRWPQIFSGRLPLNDVMHSDVFGMDMLVAHGHQDTLNPSVVQSIAQMAEAVQVLGRTKYMIIDLQAGLEALTMACFMSSAAPILVITADPPALSAAHDWLGHLWQSGFKGPINVVLSQIQKPSAGQSVFIQFRDLAQKAFGMQVNLWGSLSVEANAQILEATDRPLALTQPDSKLLQDIQMIGDRLLAELPPQNQAQTFSHYLKSFLNQHQAALQPLQKASARQTTASKEFQHAAQQVRPDLPRVLHKISEQLGIIATELGTIRRMMERPDRPEKPIASGGPSPPEGQTMLDFDTFVSRRKKIT